VRETGGEHASIMVPSAVRSHGYDYSSQQLFVFRSQLSQLKFTLVFLHQFFYFFEFGVSIIFVGHLVDFITAIWYGFKHF
jgi:hypothetical protein